MNLRGLIVWAAYRKGANLRGANLQEADLRGAVSSKRLLRLNGFKYDVIINGMEAQIGCKHKTIQEWIKRDWSSSSVPKEEQALILELFKKVFINE